LGRVDVRHPMWSWLRGHGVPAADLEWFSRSPCPPDVVGLNYYLTSDRFLDDRLELYPPSIHGGNATHRYADVEAVRVRSAEIVGHEAVLREAWERYRVPVALTEVHLGCWREDQMRWLMAAWAAASAARQKGANVQAVCVWALLGSHDWTELLTKSGVHYEPGVFDVRSSPPRSTALATIVRALAKKGEANHPVLASPGWWAREDRFVYAPPQVPRPTQPAGRPILITGGSGRLAFAFERRCEQRGLAAVRPTRSLLDITKPDDIARAIEHHRPWAIVNAAGFTEVDQAEARPGACWRDNVTGIEVLCGAAERAGLPLVTFSSDLVFDGRLDRPYVETDVPAPASFYGITKAEAERVVEESGAKTLLVRSGPLFGPWDAGNFAAACVSALRRGRPWRAANDLLVSPTYVPHLVDATLDVLIDREEGIWHLANLGRTTWSDLARSLAALAGLDPTLVEACPARELGLRASRPRQSVLDTNRGQLLPLLDDAMQAFVQATANTDFESTPRCG